MTKDELLTSINTTYQELVQTLAGTDLIKINEITLKLHAMVHPAEVSGQTEKTVADYVWDYLLAVLAYLQNRRFNQQYSHAKSATDF